MDLRKNTESTEVMQPVRRSQNKKEGIRTVAKRCLHLFLLLFVCICCLHISSVYAGTAPEAVSAAGGKWLKTKAGVQFQEAHGKKVKDTWLKSGEKLYYIKTNGYLAKGWFSWSGNRYHAGTGGEICTGGWKKIGKALYYFCKDGRLARNCRVGDYYVNGSGVRVKNTWMKKDGRYMFFGKDGKLARCEWIKWKKNVYYVDASGEMVTARWVRHGTGYSYLDSNGKMVRSRKVNGYKIGASGISLKHTFTEKYVFFGDSRTVGLEEAVGNQKENMYISKWGGGVNWMKSTGGPLLRQYLNENPKVTVFLCLGANEPEKASAYASYYKTLISRYKKTKFYVVSVNPVQPEKRADLKQRAPRYLEINRLYKKNFKSLYIDCYQYLLKNGFEAYDGLHYTSDTYLKIYEFLMKKCG